MPNYYSILGIDKNANENEIKRAYRKLMVKFHPDKTPYHKVTKQYHRVCKAYEVLSDPTKKKEYDFHLNLNGGYHTNHYANLNGHFYNFNDFDHLFREFEKAYKNCFYPKHKVKNIEVNAIISIKNSFYNIKDTICFNINEICNNCGGKINNKIKCSTCDNRGFINKHKIIDILIPRGTKPGTTFCLSKAGDEELNKEAGDILITIEEKSYDGFERKNFDLTKTIDISSLDLILGTELILNIMDYETVKVKIKPKLKNNSKLRIIGKGLFYPSSDRRGDLIITLNIYTPQISNTSKVEKYISQLKKLEIKHDKKAQS